MESPHLASMLLLDSLAIAAQNANCVSEETPKVLFTKRNERINLYNLGEELPTNGNIEEE
jgi:hypothetical protein